MHGREIKAWRRASRAVCRRLATTRVRARVGTRARARVGPATAGFSLVAAALLTGIAVAGCGGSGSGGGKRGARSSPAREAREYIRQERHDIDASRAAYEHVARIAAFDTKTTTEADIAMNELAKVAQAAHAQISSAAAGMLEGGGNESLSQATRQLSEGASQLGDAMAALVSYTGDPTRDAIARFATELQRAKALWNRGVEAIWRLADEPAAPTLG